MKKVTSINKNKTYEASKIRLYINGEEIKFTSSKLIFLCEKCDVVPIKGKDK